MEEKKQKIEKGVKENENNKIVKLRNKKNKSKKNKKWKNEYELKNMDLFEACQNEEKVKGVDY